MKIKIIGFMTIKNDWPLAAVAIAHALINHVDKMYVTDNGSRDGTWQGLKILQEVFPDRLIAIYYESEMYNQKAISHALSHLESGQESQHTWGIFLDADEFLIFNNPKPLKEFLSQVDLCWNAIISDLINYIPPIGFQEEDLDSYASINVRASVIHQFANERDLFRSRAEGGEIYWQNWKTKHKVLLRQEAWKRLGYGGHQVEYGDGKWMESHDSRTAVGAETYGLFRAHLPFTSLRRLKNRSLLNHSDVKGNGSRFFLNKDLDSLIRTFSQMEINKNSELYIDSLAEGRIVMDDRFSQSITSVFPMLKPRWEELVSAPFVKSETNDKAFASLVGMAAEYIQILDELWNAGNSHTSEFEMMKDQQ
jgi:hypothetical protein